MSKALIIVVVLVLVAGGVWYAQKNGFWMNSGTKGIGMENPTGQPPVNPVAGQSGQATVIRYTASGFIPPQVTVKKGGLVTFTNVNSSDVWPASAKHPTHTVYPGSDILKCGKLQTVPIFDACHGLKTGESWTFRFDNVGTWNYHNHLNPKDYGSVTVE